MSASAHKTRVSCQVKPRNVTHEPEKALSGFEVQILKTDFTTKHISIKEQGLSIKALSAFCRYGPQKEVLVLLQQWDTQFHTPKHRDPGVTCTERGQLTHPQLPPHSFKSPDHLHFSGIPGGYRSRQRTKRKTTLPEDQIQNQLPDYTSYFCSV